MWWTDQDRIDALVWQAEEDNKLPCGHPADEALDQANEEAYEVRRVVCHACHAIYSDVDTLVEPKSTRYTMFVPQLESD